MTPPNKIYLQWYDEDGNELNALNEEVSWCADKINDTDVEYTRAPQWIRTDERLPEDGQKVIIYDDVNKEVTEAMFWLPNKTFYGGDDYWQNIDSVHFWQPLPERPKKEEPK